MDLAPTILHLMGLAVPDDMDGRVLTSALSLTRPVTYVRTMEEAQGPGAALSGEETAEVEERLRSLGYLG
jgi:arylsulfatase A-like enzyme